MAEISRCTSAHSSGYLEQVSPKGGLVFNHSKVFALLPCFMKMFLLGNSGFFDHSHAKGRSSRPVAVSNEMEMSMSH